MKSTGFHHVPLRFGSVLRRLLWRQTENKAAAAGDDDNDDDNAEKHATATR